MKKFEAQIDDIIKVNEKRMNALIRQSTQMVIDEAQTPVAKGGKMRVDTGFLRASGRIGLNNIPSGPSRPEADKTYDTDENGVGLKLAESKPGDTIYFTWSASYARAREAYDGFLESAVQKWPEFVAKVTENIKRKIK